MATMARFTNASRQPARYKAVYRLIILHPDRNVVLLDFPNFYSLSAHLSGLFALGSVDTYFVRKLNF